MANEITKFKSSRKVSSSPINQEIPGDFDMNNNDAILDCKNLIYFALLKVF